LKLLGYISLLLKTTPPLMIEYILAWLSSCTLTKSTTISKKINLSAIPEEYHEYADVFSKSKAETLAPHCPYDLQIDLEKNSHPLVGTIYSLSKFEQEALKEFIDKNLTNGFICSTSSPHRALVLFVKKKDESLQLCVDFCGLNKITKKD